MNTLKYISYGMMALGVMLLLVGILFEVMQLPDLWRGIISGPIMTVLGLVLFFIYRFNQKKA